MEARIAKPEKTVTISYYWVANFKLDEINTEFKVENRKKNLNHCTIRYSQKREEKKIVKHAKI